MHNWSANRTSGARHNFVNCPGILSESTCPLCFMFYIHDTSLFIIMW